MPSPPSASSCSGSRTSSGSSSSRGPPAAFRRTKRAGFSRSTRATSSTPCSAPRRKCTGTMLSPTRPSQSACRPRSACCSGRAWWSLRARGSGAFRYAWTRRRPDTSGSGSSLEGSSSVSSTTSMRCGTSPCGASRSRISSWSARPVGSGRPTATASQGRDRPSCDRSASTPPPEPAERAAAVRRPRGSGAGCRTGRRSRARRARLHQDARLAGLRLFRPFTLRGAGRPRHGPALGDPADPPGTPAPVNLVRNPTRVITRASVRVEDLMVSMLKGMVADGTWLAEWVGPDLRRSRHWATAIAARSHPEQPMAPPVPEGRQRQYRLLNCPPSGGRLPLVTGSAVS